MTKLSHIKLRMMDYDRWRKRHAECGGITVSEATETIVEQCACGEVYIRDAAPSNVGRAQ